MGVGNGNEEDSRRVAPQRGRGLARDVRVPQTDLAVQPSSGCVGCQKWGQARTS